MAGIAKPWPIGASFLVPDARSMSTRLRALVDMKGFGVPKAKSLEQSVQDLFIKVILSPSITGTIKMKFDAMAAAVDWLDAYRAGDIDVILEMFAEDAAVECRCGGMTTIIGKEGLRAYWKRRLQDYPASDLDDVQPSNDGAAISYHARDRVVGAMLEFNPAGRITLMRCGDLERNK